MSEINDTPPSEREWTLEEQEEFFASQDAITGLFGGAVANNACRNDTWLNLSVTSRGIHVTSITPPKQGWPIGLHCPICKETVLILSPWACKPTVDGKEFDGYHIVKDMCGHETLAFRHNMQLGMKGYNAPIELRPGALLR